MRITTVRKGFIREGQHRLITGVKYKPKKTITINRGDGIAEW